MGWKQRAFWLVLPFRCASRACCSFSLDAFHIFIPPASSEFESIPLVVKDKQQPRGGDFRMDPAEGARSAARLSQVLLAARSGYPPVLQNELLICPEKNK